MMNTPPGREPWKWAHTPSTTIAGDPRITSREHHAHGEQNSTSFRLTLEEMTILQTYPPFNREEPAMKYPSHVVLDLFAGTGVGVAIKDLGAREFGVENMPEAVASRDHNGMETIYRDAWDADSFIEFITTHDDETVRNLLLSVDDETFAKFTLWASPPCQAFSMAGNGAGRKALDQVLGIIAAKQYRILETLRRKSVELGDERIGLVLTPLHYAFRFRPEYIALEQVPPVLPVWQAMAEELREMGYSVWTGLLHAEQYGVPQTRKRAILMARADGVEVTPPVPTHSKYYSREPERLDAGVKKWVSMEEALGWGMKVRPYPTVSTGAGTSGGGTDPMALGGSGARKIVTDARAAGPDAWTEKAAA